MMRAFANVTIACLLCLVCTAHRGLLNGPGSCDEDFGTSSEALSMPDASISWSFKHYFDCTRRAVWARFKNPKADFRFYVGVGIPPLSRQAHVRASALIVGPGLPKLTKDEFDALPSAVSSDPIFSGDTSSILGALMFQSPQDQSTCSHLGRVMKQHTSVVNGRCNFFEPFGQTNSWRVLDADDNIIPIDGAEYYVVVWLHKHESGKVGIALGTWREDFWTPMQLETPSCVRSMGDFSEKRGSKLGCFPVVSTIYVGTTHIAY